MSEPEPVLDARILADLAASVGDDRAFVVDLIRTYLDDSAVQLAAIRAAIAADDAAALARPSHTLKSSSATLGALRLAAHARTLEMAGRSGALDDDARRSAATIGDDVEATSGALRAWMAGEHDA